MRKKNNILWDWCYLPIVTALFIAYIVSPYSPFECFNNNSSKIDKMLAPVVEISSINKTKGSGVIFKKFKLDNKYYEYYILSAYHITHSRFLDLPLVEDGFETPLSITLFDNKQNVVKVVRNHQIDENEEKDLAIIKIITTVDLYAATISTHYPSVFDEVYFVGCQLGHYPEITKGIVSGFEDDFIVTNAAIAPGSSGGGLFDSDFNLIGIGQQIGMTDHALFAHIAKSMNLKEISDFVNKSKIYD